MIPIVHTEPITIHASKNRERYQFFMSQDSKISAELSGATFYAFHILRKMYPDFFPDRGAVWFNYELIMPFKKLYVTGSTGDQFPDQAFERNCRLFCIEKTTRTINRSLICSHQERDPAKNEWGGSARLEFLILDNERSIPATIVGACSGRKEWEDLAITLAAFHFIDLVQFDDPQVQNILRLADMYVTDDPTAKPSDKSICTFTQEFFEKVRS